MPTYQVTTDKGTYQVETDPTSVSSSQSPQPDTSTQNVTNALNDLSGTPEQKSPEAKGNINVGDEVMNNIAQFGKNAYSVTPFAKRIAQLTGSGADEIYAQVGQPQGVLENISALAGQMAPQIALATPFMKGSNILLAGAQDAIKANMPNMVGKVAGGIVGSPMVRGAAGLGVYSGTKKYLEGGDGQEITDATTEGLTQGLIYGALTKMGATLVPKKLPFAETAGSAVGGAIAGAMTSSGDKDEKAAATFLGGLAALTPEERMDFHKIIANNVGQADFAKYMRNGLQIPEADIKTIQDNGMNEIQRVGTMEIPVPNQLGGQDILTPVQIAQKFYQSGIQTVREKLGTQFDQAIKSNETINPKDIDSFVSNLKKQVDNYADPTSPIVTRFNKTYNALQGFRPTTTEVEEIPKGEASSVPGLNLRKISINDLPPKLQEQARKQLGQSGDITNLTLNSLHELKQNLYDAVSDKTWRDPGNTTPEERFAKSLGNQIGKYIGKNNDLYQQASSEWNKMKGVESDIRGLNTNNLGKDWARLAPANRVDMMNTLNGISTYFKTKGVSQFDPKGLLDKYHAYNSINNPDPTSFRNNASLKIAFERGASIMGAAAGLPFGLHGAAIGGAIGYMTALHYMRPSSYIPVLKQMKPNLRVPNSMNSEEALATLKKLVAKREVEKEPIVK